jgi:formylmethanofuran dehydrogenase subunit E
MQRRIKWRHKEMIVGIKCQNCGKEIPEDEVFATEGKTLCEDCYIDMGIGSGYATPGENGQA